MKPSEFKRAARYGSDVDLYGLFDLDERYDIDLSALEESYLSRSKQVHPDRFVNAPAADRVAALQRSMQLNDAYETIKRPLPRAEYLLVRNGVAIGDNEALDPGFLMEVLELREELQDARQAGDTARLRTLEDAMLDRRDAAMERLAAAFARLYDDRERDALGVLKTEVILLRYITRYLEELDGALEELDGEPDGE